MIEKKRIIRVISAKIKPAYYNLSEKEQKEFMRKDREKSCKSDSLFKGRFLR